MILIETIFIFITAQEYSTMWTLRFWSRLNSPCTAQFTPPSIGTVDHPMNSSKKIQNICVYHYLFLIFILLLKYLFPNLTIFVLDNCFPLRVVGVLGAALFKLTDLLDGKLRNVIRPSAMDRRTSKTSVSSNISP